LHHFDTVHECDRQTDRRPDDGKDARSILLSRVKIKQKLNAKQDLLFMRH